jgi:hypothetical protein
MDDSRDVYEDGAEGAITKVHTTYDLERSIA